MSDLFGAQLEALKARALYRQLREIGSAQGSWVELNGRRLVNFSSNDYLGLANDPRLRDAAIATIETFGVGAGASRLISGTQSPHVQLERSLADWKGTEAALTFSSGYAAAVGTIPALVSKQDVIILDKLCHASLIDGAKLSGAVLRVFPHNNMARAESLLGWARREHSKARILILTESVFSMDGDLAPLGDLVTLKETFGALLFVDEAHAVGVLGGHGRGLAAADGLTNFIDVHMGTLSKALGTSGGYICGGRSLIDWLINQARSFIFSTACPGAIAGAARAAVELLNSAEGEERRQRLARKIDLLHEQLPSGAIKTGSAIVPWIVGDEQGALALSQSLLEKGFLVPAIRYPTVARGSARLRITLTSEHSDEQISSLATALKTMA
jgi:glycine C-acetyltransferase/8-amino-7-oxononanoate synthase